MTCRRRAEHDRVDDAGQLPDLITVDEAVARGDDSTFVS
jgi:hypothetical protein